SELDTMAKRIGTRAESHCGESEQRVWQEIRDLPLQADRLVFRVSVPRTAVAEVLSAVQSWRSGAQDPAITADIAMGTVWIVYEPSKLFAGHFSKVIAMAQHHRGHAVMFAAPAELKQGIEVWGPSPASFSLMREIKQRFDPTGILNPGRFIGGL
ncbi:MAG: FAD-linked oxidase C-terminal domain-containing protein, partial [Candidatus Binatia bacterium]